MCFSEPRKCSLILWSICAFLSAASSAAFADEKDKPRLADDLEALEIGLIFNPVVRHTDTGRPVTLRQQTIINMAKKIVEIRRKAGDDARDLKIRAKAAAKLQAKQKAVADRIAAGETIVTKNFIIPGTTPHASSRIHDQDSGLRVADAGNGASRTQYVVNGNLFDDNESQTCALGEDCLGAQSEKRNKQQQVAESDGEVQTQTKVLSTFQDVTIQRKRISREKAQKLANERGAGIAEIRPQAASLKNDSNKQQEKSLKEFGRSSPNASDASDVPETEAPIDDNEENLTAEEIGCARSDSLFHLSKPLLVIFPQKYY